jgi:hypothetical protein
MMESVRSSRPHEAASRSRHRPGLRAGLAVAAATGALAVFCLATASAASLNPPLGACSGSQRPSTWPPVSNDDFLGRDASMISQPGVNGRVYLAGNLVHTGTAGTEIHAYPFTGTLPDCLAPPLTRSPNAEPGPAHDAPVQRRASAAYHRPLSRVPRTAPRFSGGPARRITDR